LAFLGLPSIQSIVEGIVNFFFQDVARALVPDFLKNASVSTIKWLVAVPDPSGWTHVGQLEGDMSYLAVSLLGVSFTAAVVRYLLVGLTGSGHPMQALSSTVISAGLLVGYPWAAGQTVDIVNTLTDGILSFPIVGAGLQRTVGIMFGGALLVGSGGVFLALLVIVGVVLAAVMFALKVLILLAFALLYVTGPLVIAVRPLPELAHLARAWGTALLGIAIVPVGWTILFAVAGALSLDATSFGAVGQTGPVGALTAHVAGAFAALLTFYLAVKLPLGVLGHLRGSLGGVGSSGSSASASARGGGGMQRVSDANARLRAGTLQAGRVAGLAAGALGAPAGGLAGVASRAGGRLSGPLAAGAAVAGGAFGARAGGARSRRSQEAAGQAVPGSSRARARARDFRERVVKAGRMLAEAPRQVRDATGFASAGEPSGQAPQGARGKPPRPPQRSAPAGEGNARASSATERGGSSDRTLPSRHSGDVGKGKQVSRGPSGQAAPQHRSAPGGRRSSADAKARRESSLRESSRGGAGKPPRTEESPGRTPRVASRPKPPKPASAKRERRQPRSRPAKNDRSPRAPQDRPVRGEPPTHRNKPERANAPRSAWRFKRPLGKG
jgi:hypothetical protein